MGVIIFNGRPSSDYGIVVEAPPDHIYPERDVEMVHVPGRNGDLVFDNGSYQNVSLSYQIALGSRQAVFYELVDSLLSWLHPSVGYARLEDSYDPEHFRMALYKEGNTFENILFHAGRATLTFEAKPQRFLKVGEKFVFIPEEDGRLLNPTPFDSLPIFKIIMGGAYSGSVSVNGQVFTIGAGESSATRTVYVNSELQDVYDSDNNNLNPLVTLSSGGFPKLISGRNEISYTGAIARVEVMPRWWTL